MLKKSKKFSLSFYIRIIGLGILISFAFFIMLFGIVKIKRAFFHNAKLIRNEYIKMQKENIKYQVMHVVKMIEFERKKTINFAKINVKRRVYNACSIAETLYKKNKNYYDKKTIIKMIADVMRSIKFEEGDSYFFIIDTNGKIILHAGNPSIENRSYLHLKNKKGVLIAKNMLTIALTKKEGFYRYSWYKPGNTSKEYEKLSFVKLFPQLNLIIGTGIYLDDIEKKIQKDIIQKAAIMRFGREGYIFINKFDGTALVSNGKIIKHNKKLWEEFNNKNFRLAKKVKKIFQMELKAAKTQNGDYIYYNWIKLTNPNKISSKISFIYGLKSWHWIIGAGVYLDEINKDVAIFKNSLITTMKDIIQYSIIVVLILIFLFIFITNKLSSILLKDIELFIAFFKNAVVSNKKINKDNIKIKELSVMADYANKMLEDKIKAEEELEREKEELSVTLFSIGDAVITTDTERKVVLMNKIAENLTGWTLNEAKGKKIEEVFNIINELTGEPVENPVVNVLKTGKIVGLANHTVLVSKSGKEYIIADSAAPIKNKQGKILGVVLVFRDITEKEQIIRELIKNEKLKSVALLASGIAHDFNNLLTGLLGNVQLAKLKLNDSEHPSNKYLTTAENSLERASNLTKQLLAFTKGNIPVFEIINIEQLLNELGDFYLSGTNVTAVYNFDENIWNINADKGQISQVISNLIINATQAMPEGGNIYISLKNISEDEAFQILNQYKKFVKIEIRDEGKGIPSDIIDYIFDPFFTTKDTGSGLGLSIVHSIIEKHDGKIFVESEEGKGTIFTIYIPAEVKTEISEKNKKSKKEFNFFNKKILVMDDEKHIRDFLKNTLKSFGCIVDTAKNGEEVIEKCKTSKFDVIILDLTIKGGMGGDTAIKKILEIDSNAKVIITSGYFSGDIISNYKQYGFKGRLRKPFNIDTLKQVIFKVLNNGTI